MEGWRIAVLVLMCVVFVAVLLVYVAVCWMYRRRQSTPNPPRSTSKKDASRRPRVGPPSDTVMYYVDFFQQIRALDLTAEGVRDGYSLQSALAHQSGLTNAEGVYLAYTDKTGHVVELDMDLLVAPAGLARRMRHTAVNPLLLSRHQLMSSTPSLALDQQSQSPVNNGAWSADANGGSTTTRITTGKTNININHHRSRSNQTLRSTTRRIDPYDDEEGYSDEEPQYASRDGDHRADSRRASPLRRTQSDTYARDRPPSPSRAAVADKLGIPEPIIFPLTSVITAATPVSILAAGYVFVDDGSVVDKETTQALEAAMVSADDGEQIRLTGHHGSGTAVVWPSKGKATITRWGDSGKSEPRTVIRKSAERVRYTTDSSQANIQWVNFFEPFTLPPGRWCVRAESSMLDRQRVKTVSRVFTVEPVLLQ